MSLPRLSLLAVALLPACGGGSLPLAYRLPEVREVTYLVTDTVDLEIEAMGQRIGSARDSEGRFLTRFEPEGVALRVTMTATEYSGSMGIPMGPTARADQSGIRGPLVLRLDGKGGVTVVSEPELSGAAVQVFGSMGLAHTFFPALPARVARVGDVWTDTVTYAGPEGPMSLRATSVFEYTIMGDTLREGRRLLEISVSGTTRLDGDGTVQGSGFSQTATAEVVGTILWDEARALLVERVFRVEGEGTVQADAIPVPLPLTLTGSSRIRLLSP